MAAGFTILRGWPRAGGLPEILGAVGRWWFKEFLGLFPDRVADWLIGRGQKVLVLSGRDDFIDLQLRAGRQQRLASTRVSRADWSAASIDQLLESHGLARKHVAIGIRLLPEDFFGRRLLLPPEAARSLDTVVVQDLTRKTPFRLEDIYHDYSAGKSAGESRIIVWQWVIQRELVQNAVTSLDLPIESVNFIDADGIDADDRGDGRAPAPRITLRRDRGKERSWFRIAASALGVGALLLAAVAGGLRYWQQESIIGDLALQVAAARSKAQQVRTAIDQVEQSQATLLRLRMQKSQAPGLLEVWEEATRVLPAHSWLAELRVSEQERPEQQIAGQHVAMTGFSTAASSLVGLIDQSPLFVDAALTAPVATDPVEGRERFTLQATIKRKDQAKKVP